MTTTLTRTRCHRCGHPLTTNTVYGGTCDAKLHRAIITTDLTGYSDTQIAKAIELVELGGIVAVGHLFLAVSSDGTLRYECAPTGECSCTAVSYGRRCYHTAAAKIVQATLIA